MEIEQKALQTLIHVHAQKFKHVKRELPTAFLVEYATNIPLDAVFTAYGIDAVRRKLDDRDKSVQWLLHQMTTYDPATSNVIGIIFDNQTVLAHVVTFGARDDDHI